MPLTRGRISQKALLVSAFCFWALASMPALGRASACTTDEYDRVAEVGAVVDGDTITLADGRHVRLVGINTPERATDRRPAEPLAEAARAALRARLAATGNRVALRFDAERKDRYGRLLAHAFLDSGANVTAQMLRDGWGAAIAVPPNLAFQACYRAAEKEARRQLRGVWGDAHYQARAAQSLDPRTTGFMRVRGRLDRVEFSRDALWLQIGRLGVRIDKAHLPYFHEWNFHALQGLQMVVRGWVSARDERLRLRLKHPNDLELLTHATPPE